MNDVVIGGRIPKSLMDQLKQLGKSNSEIINEALVQYINQKTKEDKCLQFVNKQLNSSEYKLLCKALDDFLKHYNRFYKDGGD